MAETPDQPETLKVESTRDLSVKIAINKWPKFIFPPHIAVHKPTEIEPGRLDLNPEGKLYCPGHPMIAARYVRGLIFQPHQVEKVCVGDDKIWTNKEMEDNPKMVFDMDETGHLNVEVYDTEGMRNFIQENREALIKLGLRFVLD